MLSLDWNGARLIERQTRFRGVNWNRRISQASIIVTPPFAIAKDGPSSPGICNNIVGGGLASRIGQAVDLITVDGVVP